VTDKEAQISGYIRKQINELGKIRILLDIRTDLLSEIYKYMCCCNGKEPEQKISPVKSNNFDKECNDSVVRHIVKGLVKKKMLYEFMIKCKYLDIPHLIGAMGRYVACMLKGGNLDDVRKVLATLKS